MPRSAGTTRHRRRARSIRSRIVLGFVGLLLAALAVTTAVAGLALSANFDRDVDERLASEVEQLEVVVDEGDPETGEPFLDPGLLFDTHLQRVLPGDDRAFYTLVDGAGHRFSFAAPADLLADGELVDELAAVDESTYRTIDSEAGRARLLIVPVVVEGERGTFVAAAFTDADRRELWNLGRSVLIVGAVVVTITALGASALAGRIAEPIERLAAGTSAIDDTDLTARIDVGPRADREIAVLADDFNAMLARLEQGFADQRRFLDDAAHEFRTPITIIRGHLDVLGDDPDEVRQTVALLHDELDRLSRYVDELLTLAQAEQPDFLHVTTVELDPFLDSIVNKLRGLGDRSWVVDSRVERSWPLDEQRIAQVLFNLAQNAVRHTGPGDEIGVGIAVATPDTDPDQLRIWVRDTGSGVDQELIDDLFERHTRSAASRSDGGVGLGLSIVDAIAVAHGGRVSVDNEQGGGARFTVELPDTRT